MTLTRKRSIGAALLAAALLIPACGSDTAAFELTSAVESQQLLAEPLPGLTILDIRTPDEFASGHIAGATNLDFYEPQFAGWLDDLDKDTPYLVYCRSGNRSASAIETMKSLGFAEVYELDGGIVSWAQSGLPLEG